MTSRKRAPDGHAWKGLKVVPRWSDGDSDEHLEHVLSWMKDRYKIVGGIINAVRYEDGVRIDERITRDRLTVACANKHVAIGQKDLSYDVYYLEHPRREEYDGFTFDPSGTAPANLYNTWQGFRYAPNTHGSYDLLKELLKDGLGDQAPWFWAWHAHMIQHPDKPVGTVIILRGEPKVGKTPLGRVFGRLFPAHYRELHDLEQLKKHNAPLDSAVYVQVDNAAFHGDEKLTAWFNHMVTAESITINRKGVDQYQVKNHCHLLFTTDRDGAIPVGLDDSRCAAFDMSAAWKGNHTKFAAMFAELESGGFGRLLHDLQHADYSAINLREPPRTAARSRMQIASLPNFTPDRWLYERLWRGEQIRGSGEWLSAIPCKDIQDSYTADNERLRAWGRRATDVEFGMRLKELCPSLVRRKKVMMLRGDDGRPVKQRVYCYEFPPLDVARTEWESAVGFKLEWPREDADADAA